MGTEPFEVSISGPDGSSSLSIQVTAISWADALALGLEELGTPFTAGALAPRVSAEGVAIAVTPTGERVRVRPLGVQRGTSDTTHPISARAILAAREASEAKGLTPARGLRTDRKTPNNIKSIRPTGFQTAPSIATFDAAPLTRRANAQIRRARIQVRTDPEAITNPGLPDGGGKRRLTRVSTDDLTQSHQQVATFKLTRPGEEPDEPHPINRSETVEADARSGLDALEMSHKNAEQIIDTIGGLVAKLVPCEGHQILFPDSEAGYLRVVSARGRRSGDLLLTRLNIPAAIEGATGEDVESLRIDGESWTFVYAGRNGRQVEFTVQSAMAVPLYHAEKTIAVLLLLNSERPEGFNEAEHNAIDLIADQAAEALFARI